MTIHVARTRQLTIGLDKDEAADEFWISAVRPSLSAHTTGATGGVQRGANATRLARWGRCIRLADAAAAIDGVVAGFAVRAVTAGPSAVHIHFVAIANPILADIDRCFRAGAQRCASRQEIITLRQCHGEGISTEADGYRLRLLLFLLLLLAPLALGVIQPKQGGKTCSADGKDGTAGRSVKMHWFHGAPPPMRHLT
jgi:hypothetical protein